MIWYNVPYRTVPYRTVPYRTAMTARVVDTRQKAVRLGQTLSLLLLLAATSWANSSTNLTDANTDVQIGSLRVSYAENSARRIVSWQALFPKELCPPSETASPWEVVGADASLIELDACALRFSVESHPPNFHRFLPDFESPRDANLDNVYEVSVVRTDDPSKYRSVLVRVTDVNEPAQLILSNRYPERDQVIQAQLVDPDGEPAEIHWQWERSIGPEQFVPISGATSHQYQPTEGDTGRFLRVRVRYSDHQGLNTSSPSDNQVVEVSTTLASVVLGPTLHTLSGYSEDFRQRGIHPSFDPQVLHYAVPCAETDVLHLQWSAPAEVRMDVDGVQPQPGPQSQVARTVNQTSDVVVRLVDSSGAVTRYTIHCVPLELYGFHTSGQLGDQLLSFTRNGWAVLMDELGVPRWHREGTAGFFFKTFQWEGERAWAHGSRIQSVVPPTDESSKGLIGEIDDHSAVEAPTVAAASIGQDANHSDTSFVWQVLDAHFEAIHAYSTVQPLTVTGRHDFRLNQSGEALLMAYQPTTRDFSFLSKDQPEFNAMGPESPEAMADTLTSSIRFNDPQGQPWGDSVETQDSVIQIVDSAGKAKWTWTSWGRIPLEDCTQGRFPGDYAHINSVEETDQGILASLRGCSTIVMLDPQAPLGEEVVWRIGESNLEQDEWDGKGMGPAPLQVVGDHLGGFCGQHAATLAPHPSESRLVLFDNGVLCVQDPTTQEPMGRTGGDYSRVVEYLVDQKHTEAVFVRDYSPTGPGGVFARSRGHVEVQADGDWLISWSGALGTTAQPGSTDLGVSMSARPPAQVSLVHPALGAEQFALLRGANGRGSVTALVAPQQVLAESIMPLQVVSTEPISEEKIQSLHFTEERHLSSWDQVDRWRAVVFSSPIVDFKSTTKSIDLVCGHWLTVTPWRQFGKPAHGFLLGWQSEPDCDSWDFQFSFEQDCLSGGICTADGRRLVSASTSWVATRESDL